MVTMTTSTTMTTSDRARQLAWLKRVKCPKCKEKRVMPGSDHPDTRWKLCCLNCGYRFKINPPKGFDE